MQIKELQSLFIQSPKLNHLNILKEVSGNEHVTQAELASHCSLSVAMVNNYMKELCANNMLEYHRKTIKSVTYHLTQAGKQYLESLQMDLIHDMVSMFEAAKEQIRDRILSQAKTDLQRVIIYGSGNLAQLAFHALEMAGVRILGVCDDDLAEIGNEFCGREILSPTQIRFFAPDAVIIADTMRTQEICQNMSGLSDKGISFIYLNEDIESVTKEFAHNNTSLAPIEAEGKRFSYSFSPPNSRNDS
jgi:predicted transcriptional regulator